MAKRDPSTKYRDWAFPAEPPDKVGYTYRQFATGEIQILQSPHGGAGTFVSRDDKTTLKAWQAITNQIKAKKQGNTEAAAGAALQVATILVATLTPQQKRRRKMPEFEPPEPPPGPDIPWVPIGGVVAVFAIILAVSRSR